MSTFEVDTIGVTVERTKYVDGVNEANMDAFLKALRSGKYAQTDGRLCRAHDRHDEAPSFCCLGVASEMAHQADNEIVVKEEDDYRMVSYNGQELLAPKATLDWLGIPEKNREQESTDASALNVLFFKADEVVDDETLFEHGYETKVSATELNDDMSLGFDVIADVFENEFLRKD